MKRLGKKERISAKNFFGQKLKMAETSESKQSNNRKKCHPDDREYEREALIVKREARYASRDTKCRRCDQSVSFIPRSYFVNMLSNL